MLLVTTWPEGNDGPDRLRSEDSEKRMIGFFNKARNFGLAFCNCTMRTLSTCLGRWRSTADFNTLVTSPPIIKDKAKQMTNARALNPPKRSALTPIAINSGLQIAPSLDAAMNKSRAGLVHCWLMT